MPPPVRHLAVLVLVLTALAARAQEKPLLRPSTDAELWISGAVELRFDEKAKKKIKKAKDDKLTGENLEKAEQKAAKAKRSFKNRFRLSGELGYRGNENLTSSKLFYTVVGARFRLHKYARLTLEHRFNFRDKYTNNTHRIDIQLDGDKDFGRMNIGYRGVFQHEFTLPTRYRDILRHRVQLTAKIKGSPLDPYVSAETFTTFHYTGNKLISIRYGLGAEWTLSNDHILDLSLRYDREQNIPAMQYRWIFGVAYEFKWRK